jgi:hypothetical protein
MLSSTFFILPILYYIITFNQFFHNTSPTVYNVLWEFTLALLLATNTMLSLLFWNNPINKCVIHWYDGTFGKISIVAFVVYIVFVKKIPVLQKMVFLAIFGLSMCYFYCSTKYSTESWLCEEHVEYHFIFHALIVLGTLWAFINP